MAEVIAAVSVEMRELDDLLWEVEERNAQGEDPGPRLRAAVVAACIALGVSVSNRHQRYGSSLHDALMSAQLVLLRQQRGETEDDGDEWRADEAD